MKVGECATQLLQEHLGRQGLYIRTGPFICWIWSPMPEVARSLAFHYADFPIEERGFADIHLRVLPGRGLRRWLRPQVFCQCADQIPFHPHPRVLAPAMLEWGLNWAIANLAHWFLLIHAAVLERKGRCVVLSGLAESGKSTLSAALLLRGWRLFSDEMALIRLQDSQLVPLARPICLKGPAIDLIRQRDSEGLLGPTLPDAVRGGIALLRPSADSVLRMDQPARVGWVVFPRFMSGSATQFLPVPKALALLRLADNSFNYSLLGSDGFRSLVRLLDQAEGCYKIQYSNLDEATEWLEKLTEGRLKAGGPGSESAGDGQI